MLLGSVEAPVNITAMCESLGVRERTLFLSCVEAFGRPPKRLLELRLSAARRALTNPEAERTVTAVAARFGFLGGGRCDRNTGLMDGLSLVSGLLDLELLRRLRRICVESGSCSEALARGCLLSAETGAMQMGNVLASGQTQSGS